MRLFFSTKNCSPRNAQQSSQIHRAMLEQKMFLVFTRIVHIKLAWSLLWEDITELSKGIMSVYKRRKKMLKTELDKQLQDVKSEGISVAI